MECQEEDDEEPSHVVEGQAGAGRANFLDRVVAARLGQLLGAK